jgi:hypothetical protein
VRVFKAGRQARDFVTPHSHRFNFCAIVLAGEVHNTLYTPALHPTDGDDWCTSVITQVCGKDGLHNFDHTRATQPSRWLQYTDNFSPGNAYYMGFEEIHSIVFDKGTEVLLFEGPELTKTSVMLEPWVDGKCVPTFKTEPWMFEREV